MDEAHKALSQHRYDEESIKALVARVNTMLKMFKTYLDTKCCYFSFEPPKF